ncbi:MAG: peptidoglycan DD-metalloendopeptidase family protein [Alphaproteobacteria bacterium]|nr:peptidoglycan DD-metalloendopeptidase family protein [Alphaproteobacteria bacterium]
MGFGSRRPFALATGCGLVVGAATAWLAVGTGTPPRHAAPVALQSAAHSSLPSPAPAGELAGQPSTPARPRDAAPIAELESELPYANPSFARADGDLEDEASHPIRHVVQASRGDTLLDLLLRAGVGRAEAHEAVDALREVYNPRDLRAGQQVTVTFDRTADGLGAGAFNGVVLNPVADRQVAATRADQGFEASQVTAPTSAETVRFQGTIRSSLFETASSLGIPATVVVEMIAALSYDIDFQRDIHPGDSFEVAFDRFTDNRGNVVREGDIRFIRLNNDGQALRLYRWLDASGEADYYTPTGESVRKALLRTPVDGARISSGFGNRRHPILGYTKMHQGVDFAVPTGTPIRAAGAGTVTMAGPNGGYGYYVRIQHTPEYASAYAHMSRFAQGIRKGSKVRQGEVVGYVGSTGRSTGPHLHYELLTNGRQVNPLSVKFASGRKLDGAELGRFAEARKQTDRMLAQVAPVKVAARKDQGAAAN